MGITTSASWRMPGRAGRCETRRGESVFRPGRYSADETVGDRRPEGGPRAGPASGPRDSSRTGAGQVSSGEAERLTVTLPDSVRQRVVEIGAEALGKLPAAEVPTPLRPFAKFAPAKRAKAAAIPMAAALEGDGAFRARVAERVHEASPDLSDSLYAGIVPAAADPHEIAAVAYILRPHGWTGMVKDALEAVTQGARLAAGEAAENEVARLTAEVAELRETARLASEELRVAQ